MAEPSFTFRPLTRPDAEAILSWRYPAPYDIYNLDASPLHEAVDSLLRPEHHYYAVMTDSGELIAFRCFGSEARVSGGDYSAEALDMGGGLRPDLTGKGLGRVVIGTAMDFAAQEFQPTRFRTTVASFNERALRTCLRLGYVPEMEFERTSDKRKFILLSREV